MSPIVPIALIVGGAVAWSLLKTVKSAVNLDFKILKFRIYNLVKNGNIVFWIQVRITNAQSTPLHVSLIDFGGYLDPKTTTQNGKTVITSKGTLIATVTDNKPFTIAANNYTDKDFYLTASWSRIGQVIGTTILQNLLSNLLNINNNQQQTLLQQILNRKVLIDGKIKAEGFVIPYQQIVNITQ